MKTVTFSVFTDAKSPFWLTQIVFSDGKRLKKSTKVPVAGGLFRGEKLSRAQAKNRALMVAQELANAAAVEAARVDNMYVRELLEVVVISHPYHRILNLRLGICLVFVVLG